MKIKRNIKIISIIMSILLITILINLALASYLYKGFLEHRANELDNYEVHDEILNNTEKFIDSVRTYYNNSITQFNLAIHYQEINSTYAKSVLDLALQNYSKIRETEQQVLNWYYELHKQNLTYFDYETIYNCMKKISQIEADFLNRFDKIYIT
ncbi:MAG: hypothetical protein QXL17_00520 [Candidatus Thermoplasmatota archaeon]